MSRRRRRLLLPQSGCQGRREKWKSILMRREEGLWKVNILPIWYTWQRTWRRTIERLSWCVICQISTITIASSSCCGTTTLETSLTSYTCPSTSDQSPILAIASSILSMPATRANSRKCSPGLTDGRRNQWRNVRFHGLLHSKDSQHISIVTETARWCMSRFRRHTSHAFIARANIYLFHNRSGQWELQRCE